jgi:hypothetical protein
MGNQVSVRPSLDKLVSATRGQGFSGMSKQQATTRVIYDTLPLTTASNLLEFFKGCASRTFPRTNLTQNRLEVNEANVFQYISFHVVTFSAAGALPVVSIEPLSTTFAGMYRSDWSLEVSTSQLVKPTPIDTQFPNFNRHAKHTTHESVKMLTNLIIPPQTEFVIRFQTTNTTTSTTKELLCMLEGDGTINSPVARY